MMGPTISTALCYAMESSINAALNYDPGSQQKIKNFEQLTLEIESTKPAFSLFISAEGTRLKLSAISGREPDAKLSGQLKDLASLYYRPQYSLAESGVRATGKLQLISDFRELLAELDIDWEAIINQATGDVLGHQIANAVKSAVSWTTDNTEKVPEYVSEFIQEELKLTPSKAELDFFSNQVDELRSATERLQAKIKQFTH